MEFSCNSSGRADQLQRAPISIFTGTTKERETLEWFRCRTSKKIPGSFLSALWDPLLYTACMSEPAILHAILSLTSTHRREVCNSGYGIADNNPDPQEIFTLQHYSKAIRHLQPPFVIKDKAAARTALMTCFVFVCLEFLRGNIATGQKHLDSGLRLIRQLDVNVREGDGTLLLSPLSGTFDEAIVKGFCRLDLQSKLFNSSHRHSTQVLRISNHAPSTHCFQSVDQAWRQIEGIFASIFHLTELARRQYDSCDFTLKHLAFLISYQGKIQAEASKCLDTLKASQTSIQDQDTRVLAYGILRTYQSMAAIMADTCLRADDESIFEAQTHRFLSILNMSIFMWEVRATDSQPSLPWPFLYMSRSIVDIGWIAPLYYTALKCRVHRIRLQAIRLLETSSHREGMWDSYTASCVARKIMEIEEDGLYPGHGLDDNFCISSFPVAQNLSSPRPPPQNQIHETRMPLTDGQTTPLELHYRLVHKHWESAKIYVGS